MGFFNTTSEYFLVYSLFIVYIVSMQNSATREQILEAAKTRFGHYGFNKTTMVEIAKDCNMSAANIYRHFNGKNDIIAVLATRLFHDQETILTEIVAQQSPSYSEKLHTFFLEALVTTHRYVTEQPKMKEMVDFICHERFDLIQSHSKTKKELIESILREGVNSCEFFIADIESTAKAFKDATVMFHTPLFMEMYCIEDLKSSCKTLVTLLLRAITLRKQD